MITIKFKSDEIRIINPTAAFYVSKEGDQLTEGEITKTVKSIISDISNGSECYECNYTLRGKTVEVVKNYDNFSPVVIVTESQKEELAKQKVKARDIMLHHKANIKVSGFKFTQKIVRNINGVFITSL